MQPKRAGLNARQKMRINNFPVRAFFDALHAAQKREDYLSTKASKYALHSKPLAKKVEPRPTGTHRKHLPIRAFFEAPHTAQETQLRTADMTKEPPNVIPDNVNKNLRIRAFFEAHRSTAKQAVPLPINNEAQTRKKLRTKTKYTRTRGGK